VRSGPDLALSSHHQHGCSKKKKDAAAKLEEAGETAGEKKGRWGKKD
jgi:hypothetical protein